jgi:Protein of unknown function (DUF4239)
LYWIYDMPRWQGTLLFSAVFVGLTWLGVVLIRPWVRRHAADQPDWDALIGAILAAFVVFYGITLALIAVSSYQSFAAANQVAAREAASLGTLYRDVSSYPEPIRGDLQAMLRDYTEYVIEEAWPAQQRGIIPEGGTVRVTAFQEKLLSFQPQTRAEEVLHAETIRQFGIFVDDRRQRLYSVSTRLPDVLWFVVGVGAVANAVLTCLFDVKRLSVHLLLAGLMSLFIAQIVFMIVAMDSPFRGAVTVGSDAYQLVQRSLMEEDR